MLARKVMVAGSLLAVALMVTVSTAHGQGGQFPKSGAVAQHPNTHTRMATLDLLATEYRRLALYATSAKATTAQRLALARFVRSEMMPRLQVDIATLYISFDSLVAGGYAVPATLFDLEAIDMLSREVSRTAGAVNRSQFDARAYALSTLVDGYMIKTQLLVLPTVMESEEGALVTLRY